MRKHVVIVDLDSTLMTFKMTHQALIKQVLRQAKANGNALVLSTSERRQSIAPYLQELKLDDDDCLITNGGQIIETAAGKLLFNRSLPSSFYQTLANLSPDLQVTLYDRNNQVQVLGKPINANFEQTAIIGAAIVGTPVALNDHYSLIDRTIQNTAYLTRVADNALEVSPVENTRPEAMDFITAQLTCSKTETTVLGDGFSVIPLFARAKNAIGFKHGSPLALRHANYQLGTDDIMASAEDLSVLLAQ